MTATAMATSMAMETAIVTTTTIKQQSNNNQTTIKQQSKNNQTTIKQQSNNNQTAIKQQSNNNQIKTSMVIATETAKVTAGDGGGNCFVSNFHGHADQAVRGTVPSASPSTAGLGLP